MFTLTPLTVEAYEWLDDHAESEPWQWTQGTLALDDQQIAERLAYAMRDAGLGDGNGEGFIVRRLFG